MTKPQQPEIARSGRGEVDPAAAKTRRGGPTDETPPTGAIPADNLPGHRPEEDQDKPTGPPPRPRARAAASATATATATKTKAPPKVEGAATATITDLNEARQDREDVEAHFRFAFEPKMVPFAFPLGITPWTTGLDISDGRLKVRFGPWSLTTPLDNVEGASVTGPYSLAKVAGPAHLSFADRGVTMATSTKRGVCIRFRDPVAALLPKSLLRHPALTVTVEDPERLVELLG